MSRSRRHGKGPRVASWRLSDADDKAKCSRVLRKKAKEALRNALPGKLEPPFTRRGLPEGPELPEKPREIRDRWGFKKDA